MAEELHVERRDTFGTRTARRLRKAGSIPAVLYGHGEENVCLAVPAEEMEAVVRHGAHLVSLRGGVNQQAIVRDLQWDTWGTHVLHVDFARVSAHEKVEVQLPVELRGEAPGLKQGGIVEQLLHEVALECRADDIPESVEVNINELNLDESVTLGQLEIPATARVVGNPEDVVVQCVEPAVAPAEEEAEVEAEPEVIGRKAEEEEEKEE